jgi:hypothetical protein
LNYLSFSIIRFLRDDLAAYSALLRSGFFVTVACEAEKQVPGVRRTTHSGMTTTQRNAGFLAQVRLPDFAALLPGYEGFFGFCGWMVSPAASIVTNFSILAARVSGFLALWTR